MARKATRREVRDALAEALKHMYFGGPYEVEPVSDSVILLNVDGDDFRITVSIPRALHGRGGPKKPEDTDE
jgi:hypothetical protein